MVAVMNDWTAIREKIRRDMDRWNKTGIPPWETPEFKAREVAEFEADAPHFHCDGCIEIQPTYLGHYEHGGKRYCHACYTHVIDGDEWKLA